MRLTKMVHSRIGDLFPAFPASILRYSLIATSLISNVINDEPSNRGVLDLKYVGMMNFLRTIGGFDSEKAYRAALFVESEIELSISAANLFGPFGCENDCWAKVDPMCVTYIRPYGDRWIEYHRTELLLENDNPNFVRKVTVPYSSFQESWSLKFSLYSIRHWDKNADWHLKNHYLIGSAECNLDQLLRLGKLELSLTDEINGPQYSYGKVIVHAERLIINYDDVILELLGTDLPKKNWLGQAELYVEIYKYHSSVNHYVLVHRTELIKDSMDPAQWKSMTIPIKRLCNGDHNRILKFVAWHWKKTGESIFIGEFHTTLNDIARSNDRIFPLKNPKKEDRDLGRISILNYNLDTAPTFCDFIRFGLTIHCVVAIDFTTLNGDPRQPGTLHHRDAESSPNMYEKAITSILSVLEYFDFDNKFPVYGFGGRCSRDPDSLVFNMGPDSSDCIGVEGVLDAYRKGIFEIEFTQSQNLALVIQKVITTARNMDLKSNYFILLILTCGELDDVDETEKVVTEASTLPISIIIVGIGDSDFTTLKELDDNIVPKRRSDRGRRDIVNFVPFNKFGSQNDHVATSYLASEFMAEIPAQVVSYVRSKGFMPYEELLLNDNARSSFGRNSRFIPSCNLRSEDNTP